MARPAPAAARLALRRSVLAPKQRSATQSPTDCRNSCCPFSVQTVWSN